MATASRPGTGQAHPAFPRLLDRKRSAEPLVDAIWIIRDQAVRNCLWRADAFDRLAPADRPPFYERSPDGRYVVGVGPA